MNDRQVDALGLQEMIRSERTREKSRSWVTRAAALIANLNSVCQLEAERRPQSCSAFRNVDVKRDRLPRFEDRTITPRECVISRLQGPGQHLGDGRYGETQVPSSMGFEERLEARSKFRVPLQEVDDGRRIDENQCIRRQIRKI